MAGQFPTSIDFTNVRLKSREPVLKSISQSGKRQTRAIGAHLWEISVEMNFLSRSEFETLWAFLMKQRGELETFTIIIPGHDVAQGAIDGTPTYTSTTSDYEIVTGGWSNNITDNAKAGDVFTIAGQTKVYQATDDLDSDGSGNGNLLFYPALRETPGASAALTFNNVTFTVALASAPEYERLGAFYRVKTLKLVEAL